MRNCEAPRFVPHRGPFLLFLPLLQTVHSTDEVICPVLLTLLCPSQDFSYSIPSSSLRKCGCSFKRVERKRHHLSSTVNRCRYLLVVQRNFGESEHAGCANVPCSRSQQRPRLIIPRHLVILSAFPLHEFLRREGGRYSFVACLIRSTVDHAFLRVEHRCYS